MPAIDFPNSPTLNQEFTAGTTIYKWDGTAWRVKQPVLSPSSFSDSNPAMSSAASAGTSSLASRSDHVHPSDTSRAAASDLSTHTSATTSVHGISNTANLVYTNDLSAKAPLASPEFTGTPTAPTAAAATNTTQIATTAFVRTEVSNIVDSAPSTLDTLNELAAALGDDPNFATTVTNSIADKVSKSGGDTITVASGTTVPLTIQNNGTGNSFVVNDEGSDTTPFVIDASGNVGIGISSPTGKLNIYNTSVINSYFSHNTSGIQNQIMSQASANGVGLEIYDQNGLNSTIIPFRVSNNTGAANAKISIFEITGDGRVKLPAGGVIEAPVSTNVQAASYTLALTDAGRLIEMSSGSAATVTVPADGTTNFPVGTKIDILRTGGGEISIAGATSPSTVTVNSEGSKLRINAQWQAVTLIKRAANTWVLIGALKT